MLLTFLVAFRLGSVQVVVVEVDKQAVAVEVDKQVVAVEVVTVEVNGKKVSINFPVLFLWCFQCVFNFGMVQDTTIWNNKS